MHFLVLPLIFGHLLLTAQEANEKYSFFAAGHTYGVPNVPDFGLYEPFMAKKDYINAYPDMAYGFLTGDVVIHSTAQQWDSVQADMATFGMPICIAAGNHDMGPEFISRFGTYYYSFTHHDDLFIVITPSLDNWNISGDQKAFLVTTLDSLAPVSRNIFVFLHELIWWSPDSIFQSVVINYSPYFPGSTNFWSEIEPLFTEVSNTVVFFAGDLGCCAYATPFMHYEYENVTLTGSGMGGGEEDNFIIVDVYEDSLLYHLIALNGDDINALGELTDFSLAARGPDASTPGGMLNFGPNPFIDELCFTYSGTGQVSFCLSDIAGRMLGCRVLKMGERKALNTRYLPSGIYILTAKGSGFSDTWKLIKP